MREVRRSGRIALLGTAGALLVCGAASVHGPEPLPLPGLLCLLWTPAPLVALAFTALHGARSPGPMSAGWKAGAAIAAVAAGLCLTGFAARIVHGSSAYAVHYGTVATTGLPDSCRSDLHGGAGPDSFGCTGVTWYDRYDRGTTGTVYTDHRFWDRYGKYYGPRRMRVDPDKLPPPSTKITVYAVGDKAYMPGDTTTSARDAIGTPPLGSLAWAGLAVPAAFVTMLDMRVRRRSTIGAAVRFARAETRLLRAPVLTGLGAAALLLGLGVAGLRSPDPLPVPGLLCLASAAAPLTALAFAGLRRRGGRPMTPRWRLLCAAAALAGATTATGAAAAVIAHTGGYVQRYGAPVTVRLPMTCRPVGEPASTRTADITECTNVTWKGPDGRTTRGTLHVSPRFWADYGHYYDDQLILDYVQVRPLLRDLAARVRFPARVSGPDAYLPAGRSIAALGRPPYPWLSAAAVPLAAVFGAVSLRRPHRTGATRTNTRTARGAGRPRGAAPVTVTSAFVRVSAGPSGLRVQRRTRTAATGESPWRDHVNLGWDQIARIGFADERHGPTILYVITSGGTRLYALDRRQLTGDQWHRVGTAIAAATAGRVTLS